MASLAITGRGGLLNFYSFDLMKHNKKTPSAEINPTQKLDCGLGRGVPKILRSRAGCGTTYRISRINLGTEQRHSNTIKICREGFIESTLFSKNKNNVSLYCSRNVPSY